MDLSALTEADFDRMRTEPKRVTNRRARQIEKRGHVERNFDVISLADPSVTYRLFWRQSVVRTSVFSVGLIRTFLSGETIVLVRYNGGYHTHRNVIEGATLPATTHRHVATERYVTGGYDPDGYAEPVVGYHTAEGALHCLVTDCKIAGLNTAPDHPDLI